MEEINLKPSYLNKSIWWLVIIGIIFSCGAFLAMTIDIEYRYFLSMIVVFIGILIVFYLNRFELEKIQLVEEKVTLTFYNKFFFKKVPESYLKHEINVLQKNNIFILYVNEKKIAVVREETLDSLKWNDLKLKLAIY